MADYSQYFNQLTGRSSNPIQDRVRMLYEKQRQPGFQAFADPHSAEAQAYANQTNAGIQDILNNSSTLQSQYNTWQAAHPQPGLGALNPPGSTAVPTPSPTGPTSSLPGLPGDTATGGTVNPTTGLWTERNIGIPNAMPNVGSAATGMTSGTGINRSGLGITPNAPRTGLGGIPAAGTQQAPGGNITTPVNRPALAQNQQQNLQQGQASTLARAGSYQNILNAGLNAVGGGGGLPGGAGNPGMPGTPAPGGGGYGGGLGGIPPANNPNNPAYTSGTQFEGGLPPLRTRTPASEVQLSDEYRIMADELEKRLNRQFSATGRNASTYADREKAKAQSELLANEVRYQDQTQYQRNMDINKLQYDRRYQANVLNYEREFQENERQYGRQMAENILQYERSFREDARDYDRVRYLVDLGFGAVTQGANA